MFFLSLHIKLNIGIIKLGYLLNREVTMKDYLKSFFANIFSSLLLFDLLSYAINLAQGDLDVFGRGTEATKHEMLTGMTVALFVLMVAAAINVHFYKKRESDIISAYLIFSFGFLIFFLGMILSAVGLRISYIGSL